MEGTELLQSCQRLKEPPQACDIISGSQLYLQSSQASLNYSQEKHQARHEVSTKPEQVNKTKTVKESGLKSLYPDRQMFMGLECAGFPGLQGSGWVVGQDTKRVQLSLSW